MVQIQELTPETLVADPRRSPAVPNAAGTHAIYSVSTHVLGEGSPFFPEPTYGEKTYDGTTQELRVLDLKTGNSTILSNDRRDHDAVWIPTTTVQVLYLRSVEKGRTQVMVADMEYPEEVKHYKAGEIDAPVSNVKLKDISWYGKVAFVVTGPVGYSGLHNPEAGRRGPSARVYDAEVPIWNTSCKPHRSNIWYCEMHLDGAKWKVQGDLNPLIDDVDLEGPSSMNTDVPCNEFDISREGIAFVARSLKERGPDESPALSIYYIPLFDYYLPRGVRVNKILIPTSSEPASITNVRFNADSSSIGFLYTSHEDPYDTRFFVASLASFDALDIFSLVTCADDEEHNPPTAFEFAGSSDAVFLRSHQLGYETLSLLKLEDGAKPTVFFSGGSCNAFYPLMKGNIEFVLTTSSSFIDSSLFQIINVPEAKVVKALSSATKTGAKFDLSPDMVAEIWYEGANGHFIHCWVIRPLDFDENEDYPWVLIPGRPGTAWNNEWSLTANFATWVAQGYVVVLPNITGSSGFGLEFTRRIRSQKGDKPFQDILCLIAYLEDVPYLDKKRSILMGTSSTAYLMNKLLAHDVAEKFCSAVYQCGTIDPSESTSHKEAVFDNFDKLHFSYPHTDVDMTYENDMARSTLFYGWKNPPPTLIIHGERNKQCSIQEVLTAFNSLQAQGVPSRLLTFPDEGPVIVKPENIIKWYKEIFNWVQDCVVGDIERGEIL